MDRTVVTAAQVPVRRIFVIVLLTSLVAGTVRISPFYLAYFNELAGGPGNGYKYLSKSDLDWGQDLRGLARYLHTHGIATVKLAYFGTDDPRRYGITYERLRPGQPATGDLAVSVTSLDVRHPGCEHAFAWLQGYKPTATIGYSIFVYHVPAAAVLPPAVPFDESSDC
jgi:hypothetical protein